MTILIDDALVTAPIRVPLVEGWVESAIPVEVRSPLVAADVGLDDIALIASPETTLLATTHLVASEVAIVFEGISPIVLRTPVRPDGIDETPIRMQHATATGEVLTRALLKPYFGITAASAQFMTTDDDPNAATAQVVVVEGLDALDEPEAGFQTDLAQAWYVLTGAHVVSHVVVVGVEAQARGHADRALATLQQAVTVGIERRREVRTVMAGDSDVDRETLAEMTNDLTFTLDADDRRSLLNLIARGTWGSRFVQRNPVFRDDLPADVRDGSRGEGAAS